MHAHKASTRRFSQAGASTNKRITNTYHVRAPCDHVCTPFRAHTGVPVSTMGRVKFGKGGFSRAAAAGGAPAGGVAEGVVDTDADGQKRKRAKRGEGPRANRVRRDPEVEVSLCQCGSVRLYRCVGVRVSFCRTCACACRLFQVCVCVSIISSPLQLRN